MVDSPLDPLEYYARPGLMTDPQEQASSFGGLPTDMAALCQVVQGLLLHMFWVERYGVALSAERRQETETISQTFLPGLHWQSAD